MNEEKQKFIGGVDFDELRAQRVQLYNAITIDLATARINEEMVFTGNYIYALEATDVDANLDIRFNELFRAAINIKKGRGVRVPFYRFYITNTAQAGKTLTLAIGIEASDFEVFDVGKALGITGFVNTIPSPRSGYTQVAESAIANQNIVVIHTVTADKVFYLVGATMSVNNSTVTPGMGTLFVTNAADVTQYIILSLQVVTVVDVVVGQDSTAYNPSIPLEIPAGYKIKVEGSVINFLTYGFIQGYEI